MNRKAPYFAAVLLLGSAVTVADTNPQSFTYQGRLVNSAGTAPLTDTVTLTFGIYDPAGNCLLYEESQSGIDLNSSQGAFSVRVGSGTRSASDRGNTLAQTFANQSSAINAFTDTHCPTGTYTPAAGDIRKLRVTVTPQSGIPTVLNPDQTLTSVPQATVAETVQGLAPKDLIQVSGATSSYVISKTDLDKLLTGLDASTLHHHDSVYAKLNSSPSFSSVTVSAGGTLTLAQDPSQPLQAATKQYVDNSLSALSGSKEGTITAGTSTQYYRGDKTWQTLNTAAVPEGSNLYFTDSRARGALSGGTGISYGVVSGTISADVGTTANKLVQLDASAKLPAIDGSQLTNINDTSKLPLAGGTMSGALSMGGNTISNLAVPVNPNDAASKAYVDAAGSTTQMVAQGTYFSDGGNPYYCRQRTVSASGYVTVSNINANTTCDTGMICSSGQCVYPYTAGNLQYNFSTHTAAECTAAGGTVVAISGDIYGTEICKFTSSTGTSSCPSGWNTANWRAFQGCSYPGGNWVGIDSGCSGATGGTFTCGSDYNSSFANGNWMATSNAGTVSNAAWGNGTSQPSVAIANSPGPGWCNSANCNISATWNGTTWTISNAGTYTSGVGYSCAGSIILVARRSEIGCY